MTGGGNKPQSLAEMSNMSKEDFEQVEDYKYRGKLSSSRLIRHMLKLAHRELSWQGKENASSLREFWYNPTKIIVENAFPEKLEEWGSNKFNRRMSQYLSSELSELVKDPSSPITYRGLNILDDSRDRELTSLDIEHDKILFVEKDSAYRHLVPLQQVYQINIVSGSGFEATALIEDLKHELDDDVEYHLLILSDYDPNGFEIAQDFRERGEKLGINFKKVERIGIYPEQVEDYLVEEQKFPVPEDEEWQRKYGINGKYGLEIEAVSEDMENRGYELRKAIIDKFEDIIDEKERYRRQTKRAIKVVHEMAVERVINTLTSELKEALKDYALEITEVQEEEGVDIKTTDFGFESELEDVDLVRDSDNEYLPEIPEEGQLHERAVDVKTDISGNAEPPEPNTYKQKNKLKRQIMKAIDEGEFKIEEYIDLDLDEGD